ncbi:MAG TPA: chloride channel protein [Candidatus Binatia bacterium]|nr:chloride channel protein [Candidatus Binatia bacterium]
MSDLVETLEDRLADFTRDRRVLLLSGMALIIGCLSAVVAWILVWLIATITNVAFYGQLSSKLQSPEHHHLGYYMILVPIIGGLIIGVIARYGSDKIRGHGIPEALEAILFGRSQMEPKVAVLKPLSSAISIGTGGPFGAEGPIIMTGGAVGSIFAQFFQLSAAERKTLLVAGASGGMAAIFASPVSAALLAVELLLFEWRPRSFIPVAIAAVSAAALRVPLLGAGPIFPVQPHAMLNSEGLVFAFLVGIAAGLGSGLLTTLVYAFEDLFNKLPIHWMWWPAIGGLFIGIGGLIEPRVLGVGYETIHELLVGHIVGAALLGILIGKSLVWSLALGSGTSGGVLAPLLMMGGALGAGLAKFIPVGDTGVWTLIGMAGMMGGTMRSPLTAMIFALELTQDLNLLPGLLAGCVAAHGVTVLLLRRSILTEKVARRGYHVMREYGVDPLTMVRVGEVMDKNPPLIPAKMSLAELSDRIARGEPEVSRHEGLLLVDDKQQLAGMITRGDVIRALAENSDNDITVSSAGSHNVIVTYADELLYEAVSKMVHNNIGRLPVVSRRDPRRIVGYIGRSNLMAGRLRHFEDEYVRERRYLRRRQAQAGALAPPNQEPSRA